MKKHLLLLLLIPLMIISSCTKDADEVKEAIPVDNQLEATRVYLKGTWTITEDKRTYYDSNNVKIGEYPGTLGQVNFDGNTTLTSTYNGVVTIGSYSVSSDKQGQYLTLGNGQGTNEIFTIVSISNTNLSISLTNPINLWLTKTGGFVETSSLIKQ
jgi:hypothetical protein